MNVQDPSVFSNEADSLASSFNKKCQSDGYSELISWLENTIRIRPDLNMVNISRVDGFIPCHVGTSHPMNQEQMPLP